MQNLLASTFSQAMIQPFIPPASFILRLSLAILVPESFIGTGSEARLAMALKMSNALIISFSVSGFFTRVTEGHSSSGSGSGSGWHMPELCVRIAFASPRGLFLLDIPPIFDQRSCALFELFLDFFCAILVSFSARSLKIAPLSILILP